MEFFWDKSTQTHRHQSKFRNSGDSKHSFLEGKNTFKLQQMYCFLEN